MKIAHLIHDDGPGGGPVAVMSLVRGLADAGERDQVVLHGGTGRIAAACEEWGVAHVRLPLASQRTVWWGAIRLAATLRRLKPDWLVPQGQWAGPIGAIAARCLGIRCAYVAQWPAFFTDWNPWRAFRNAMAEWIPCRLADWVVAPSPSVRYEYLIRGWAHEARLVCIPNVPSCDASPSTSEVDKIRLENGWSAEQVHVVSVGRLSDQKRLDWLLTAWRDVQERCPSARLWIVGDGPEAARLRRMRETLAIEKTCRMLGARPRGIAYFAAGDIAAVSSMYESYGYAAREAHACGKPVVANAVCGLMDFIHDGQDGFLVAAGDAAQMAARLIQLIEDPALRSRMGACGRQRALGEDSRAVVAQYLQLFRGK